MIAAALATTASAHGAPTPLAAAFSAAVGGLAALVLMGLLAGAWALVLRSRRPEFRVVSGEEGRALVAEARARRAVAEVRKAQGSR